eukprot:COSAG05_NODE_3863_length_1801_cov_2.178613_2_plen_174_part_00
MYAVFGLLQAAALAHAEAALRSTLEHEHAVAMSAAAQAWEEARQEHRLGQARRRMSHIKLYRLIASMLHVLRVASFRVGSNAVQMMLTLLSLLRCRYYALDGWQARGQALRSISVMHARARAKVRKLKLRIVLKNWEHIWRLRLRSVIRLISRSPGSTYDACGYNRPLITMHD